MAGSVKQDLREKKQRALKSYYAALNLRAVFEREGNMEAVASYEILMSVCLYRLRALRFLELYNNWPLLVESVK